VERNAKPRNKREEQERRIRQPEGKCKGLERQGSKKIDFNQFCDISEYIS